MREHVLALLSRHLPGPLRPTGGSNILTKCPFHKGGQERTPSFSVNVDEGLWHCFTCHEAGNLRTLLKKLQLPRDSIDTELSVVKPFLEAQQRKFKIEKENFFSNNDVFKAESELPEALLGVYDWMPTMLVEDGFDPNLLRDMEIGYDRVNNRITYPLRDMYGNLAGISGGVTPWSKHQMPKYKVYQGRRRGHDGKWIEGDFGPSFDEKYPDYRCENHDFLWNFDRVMPRILSLSDPNATVYLVEGFKACLWMIQSGFENTVALMGSYISDRQQKMLHRLGCTVVLCLDNDNAGRKATFNVGDFLWKPMYGRIKVLRYPQGDDKTQPDDYETSWLRELVLNAQLFTDYVNEIRNVRT